MSNTIQFKRNLNFKGTYQEARQALLDISLAPGEPILVSYLDENIHYFVCIGTGNGTSSILPVYNSLEEINENIIKEINKVLINYKYDWVSDIDIENSNVQFTRDETTGNIKVNYTGSGEVVGYASELETIIGGTTMTQQEFNVMIMNCLSWMNII